MKNIIKINNYLPGLAKDEGSKGLKAPMTFVCLENKVKSRVMVKIHLKELLFILTDLSELSTYFHLTSQST